MIDPVRNPVDVHRCHRCHRNLLTECAWLATPAGEVCLNCEQAIKVHQRITTILNPV